MKVTKKQNIRVEVTPYVWGKWDEDYAVRKANEIKDAIKRHIDDVESVDVYWDTVSKCSHCGYDWEEDSLTKEPQCCQKAQDEFYAEKKFQNDTRH